MQKQIKLGSLAVILITWASKKIKIKTVFNLPGNPKYLPLLADAIINNTGYEILNLLITEGVLDPKAFIYVQHLNQKPWDKLNYYYCNGSEDIVRLYKNIINSQSNLNDLIISSLICRKEYYNDEMEYLKGLPKQKVNSKIIKPKNLLDMEERYNLMILDIIYLFT